MPELPNSEIVEIDEIVSYLRLQGAHILADLIATGQFRPDMQKWSKHLKRIRQIQQEGRDSIERAKQRRSDKESIASQSKEKKEAENSSTFDLRHEILQMSQSKAYRNAIDNIIEHKGD